MSLYFTNMFSTAAAAVSSPTSLCIYSGIICIIFQTTPFLYLFQFTNVRDTYLTRKKKIQHSLATLWVIINGRLIYHIHIVLEKQISHAPSIIVYVVLCRRPATFSQLVPRWKMEHKLMNVSERNCTMNHDPIGTKLEMFLWRNISLQNQLYTVWVCIVF